MKQTNVLLSRSAEKMKTLTKSAMDGMKDSELAMLGITGAMDDGVKAAMDSAPNMVTTANINNFVQFFQWWMPEAIEVLTQKRNADLLLGRDTVGTWEDDEVVFNVIEKLGQVRPYSDVSDVPLVSYNAVPERRQNVRFELGLMSTKLSDLRATRMRINPDKERRAALALAFEINRNMIAFNGFNPFNEATNATGSLTYGILNDPNLFAYDTLDTPKTFANSTFEEMTARINTWMTAIVEQTKQNANPFVDKFTLGIAPAAYNAMATVMNSLGTKTVLQWFTETYKHGTVLPIQEFAGANGGDDVAYIIMDQLGGRKVAMQAVTAEMRLLGIRPDVKGTVEGYTSGTAGTIVLQPLGVYRASGI